MGMIEEGRGEEGGKYRTNIGRLGREERIDQRREIEDKIRI